MSSAYYASLVCLPDIIDEPGEYETRCGESVQITETSRRHDHNCVGTYSNMVLEHWHKSGRIYAGKETANDVVAKVSQDMNC